jgi:zinc transporter ZupT
MTTSWPWAVAAAALLFVAVHLFVGRLHVLRSVPRSSWLSLSGGAAVAYVFLHLLPELAEHQRNVADPSPTPADARSVYLVALLGLATFYGLERHARRAGRGVRNGGGEDPTGWRLRRARGIVRGLQPARGLPPRASGEARSGGALPLRRGDGPSLPGHDHGLREHYGGRYDRLARWWFAAAVIAGCVLGIVVELPATVIAMLFAFLAGGVLLNVMKEELPEERESAFLPFVAGVAAYAALLWAAA